MRAPALRLRMVTAMRHKREDNVEKRLATFSRPDSEILFLPPESFLRYYSLLVEAVYMTKQPEPEVRTGEIRKGGMRIPVRNFRAFTELKRVDSRLYGIKRWIVEYLNSEPEMQSLAKSENGISPGKVGVDKAKTLS